MRNLWRTEKTSFFFSRVQVSHIQVRKTNRDLEGFRSETKNISRKDYAHAPSIHPSQCPPDYIDLHTCTYAGCVKPDDSKE